MPIRLLKTKAVFEGQIGVEEADALQTWLSDGPDRRVDLERCTHIHPASLQLLLSARARPATMPQDPALAAWLTSLFLAN